MRKFLLGGLFLVVAAGSAWSQNSSDQNHYYGTSERSNVAHQKSGDHKNVNQVIIKESKTDLTKPEDRVVATQKSSGEFPKPATKTGSPKIMSKIDYSINNDKSALGNLLMLIEIKEKANETQNVHLTKSSEYDQLLSDIDMLRNDFDNHVESKGIENCSQLEQSHYLAFLKQEGKEEDYSKAISKLH